MFMTRIAAIDLGTHNCRLMVAEARDGAFKTLKATSKIVRLGEGAALTGRLQPDAIARTVDALKTFSDIIRNEKATKVRCVVTEACRMAENRNDFLHQVREDTGLNFEIISEQQEVRLTTLATWPLINSDRVMTLDIGGGSTELVLLEYNGGNITVLDWQSFPMGVVRGRDAMESPEVNAEEFAAMTGEVAKPMAAFFARNVNFFNTEFQVIGSSGTVTTLAATLENLTHYRRDHVDGLTCRVADMVDLAGKISLKPLADRRANPLMGPERAEYMVPGCAIFKAIFSYINADYLTAADRGLREGIINAYLSDAPEVVFQNQTK